MEVNVKKEKGVKVKVAIKEELYCYSNGELLSEHIFPIDEELSPEELENLVKDVASSNKLSKARAEAEITFNYIVKRIITINQ